MARIHHLPGLLEEGARSRPRSRLRLYRPLQGQ